MRCMRKNPVKNEYDGEQRRRQFRIEYPLSERPTLLIGEEEPYEVIDVSEEGVRFFDHPTRSFLPGQKICGQIHFRDEQTVEIEGSVFRMMEGVIVLLLSRKIPYKLIVAEELYLRKKKIRQ